MGQNANGILFLQEHFRSQGGLGGFVNQIGIKKGITFRTGDGNPKNFALEQGKLENLSPSFPMGVAQDIQKQDGTEMRNKLTNTLTSKKLTCSTSYTDTTHLIMDLFCNLYFLF